MVTVRLNDGSTRQVTSFRELDRVEYLVDENGNDFLPTLTNPSAPYSAIQVRGVGGDYVGAPQVKP